MNFKDVSLLTLTCVVYLFSTSRLDTNTSHLPVPDGTSQLASAEKLDQLLSIAGDTERSVSDLQKQMIGLFGRIKVIENSSGLASGTGVDERKSDKGRETLLYIIMCSFSAGCLRRAELPQ